MRREFHVRFCEGPGGKIPRATRPVFWCRSREAARAALSEARGQVERLGLELHARAYVQRSHRGLSFLGYRVFPGRLLLSRRKQVRYRSGRRRWEEAHAAGLIDGPALQAGYAAQLASVIHADSLAWRRAEHTRRPVATEA